VRDLRGTGKFFSVTGLIFWTLTALICIGLFNGGESVSANESFIENSIVSSVMCNFYVYREGNGPQDEDFLPFLQIEPTGNIPLSIESVLGSSQVIVNERFLREKGMQSTPLGQGGFVSHGVSSAAEFRKSHTSFIDLSRLHTQIVQRK
jgi:hypothetical protein